MAQDEPGLAQADFGTVSRRCGDAARRGSVFAPEGRGGGKRGERGRRVEEGGREGRKKKLRTEGKKRTSERSKCDVSAK